MDFQEAAMSSREEMHKALFSTVNGFERATVVLVTAWNRLKKNQNAEYLHLSTFHYWIELIVLFSLHACASKGVSTFKGNIDQEQGPLLPTTVLLMGQTAHRIVSLHFFFLKERKKREEKVAGSVTTSGPPFLSVGEFVFQQATNPVVYYAGL